MDNYTLKLFVNLSETLHFGKTSQNCHISPSALSRQIQRLEQEVGERLFERDNRRVTLTSAGLLFKEYAVSVLARWRELKEKLMLQGQVLQGEISLYASVTACYSVLPPVLARFRELYPHIHIKLSTGAVSGALQKVSDGALDIVVAARPEHLPENLYFKAIAETPLCFVAPGREWVYGGLDPAAWPWEKVPMIMPERELARKRIDAWFEKKGLEPHIYAETEGNEAALAMVNLGFGVGIIPELVVEKGPFSVDVEIVEVQPALKPYEVGICVHRRRAGSPLVKAFWDSLDEAY